jgi:glycosyltransferase involved in cell wall biosynthesis
MLKVVQITTDNRVHLRDYKKTEPYFGTAPEGLLQGFAAMPQDVEVHVISATRHAMICPSKIAPNIFFHQPLLPSWGMGRSLFTGAVLATRKLLRDIRPDIVHGQGTERECALAAVFSGYPNILTIHGNMRVHATRGENQGKPYYRLASALESLALRKTDGVVSISSYTDDLVKPLAKKTWLLPNAADRSYFQASPSPQEPPTILFVGGLDERKNPISFIKACCDIIENSGWKIRLCGTGSPDSTYRKELSKFAGSRPWIELAGWKSRSELLAEMEKSSLLVLPTLEDNCPMVVLEAMAVGLPVIASRVGGIPDLIDHGITGMMFDPLDPESMREITAQMINNTDQRSKIAIAARVEAKKRFHPKVVAKAHLEIYREILGSRKSGI